MEAGFLETPGDLQSEIARDVNHRHPDFGRETPGSANGDGATEIFPKYRYEPYFLRNRPSRPRSAPLSAGDTNAPFRLRGRFGGFPCFRIRRSS